MKEFSLVRSAILVAIGLLLAGFSSRRLAAGAERPAAESKHLFPFRQSGPDGKWGYMDRRGKTVIKPRFDQADDFADGLAYVVIDGQRAFLDHRGVVRVKVPPEWRYVGRFSEGLAVCLVKDKYGFVDRRGRIVIQPRYDEAEDFREGLAAVGVYTKGSQPDPRTGSRPTLFGFVDKTGQEVIKPVFQSVDDFHEGLACVFLEGGLGYIDKHGKVVIRLDHELKNYPNEYTFYGRGYFSDGLALMEVMTADGEEDRFLNKTGEFLSPDRFPDPSAPFAEGVASFSRDDKCGYIDRAGRVVCKPTFDQADCFSEGFAAVRVGDYWGYVDRQMRFIVRPGETCPGGRGPLNDVEPFSGGLARVHIGGVSDRWTLWIFGAWFYMDEHGRVIRRVRRDVESGPGYGSEYRPHGHPPQVTKELKKAWRQYQRRD